MSAPLLDLTIRHDWREITQRLIARDERLWSAMRFAVLSAAIAAELLASVFAPWGMAMSSAVFCALFWVVPFWSLWRVFDPSANARRVCMWGMGAIGLAILVATAGMALGDEGASWVGGAALLAVGIGASVLLCRKFPHPMRAFGLVSDAWAINLVIGGAIGAALGFHLLIVFSALPDATIGVQPMPALGWFLGYQIGLRVLGEELFFRGLGFYLLTSIGVSNRAMTGWLVLLNLFVYIWLFEPARSTEAGLLVLYSGVMALVCTRLRLRQESLLPGLVCQGVFVLFMAGVIRL
jgi:hypothetical protein